VAEVSWEEVKEIASAALREKDCPQHYADRYEFEIKEIEKQGAITYWVNLYNDGKTFTSNPNFLLFPWLLGMVKGDPIAARTTPMLNTVRASTVADFNHKNGFIPPDLIKDPDQPDIDIDCLPEARDPIKDYATERYGSHIKDGYGAVCSVGTWQTYKFRSALIDVCTATGWLDKQKILSLTTQLPDDVDELKDGGKSNCKGRITNVDGEETECGNTHNSFKCPKCGSTDTDGLTIGKLLKEHEDLRIFAKSHPKIVNYAVKLVGRVRNMGMHAGALIIADRTLYGNIPLARSSTKNYWISMWTEGRNTQLSKFGYIKWDILGLKTLKYIFECCKFIEKNRGISFGKNMSGWDDINPSLGRAGHFFDGDGNKRYIELNDEHALALANNQQTDGIFQFDTDLAKSILKNGVRNFEDLMLFNAMGHPGPMASIPEAVANREDKHDRWKKKLHPIILEVLKDTYGVIVYQEQLQAIWQLVAGFTAPEAQEARKAVAKKWTHKLKPIREKWVRGASRVLGEKESEQWWTRMETFGRYAFNRSHAVSYCLVAHRCLWLKAHFAPEFWAAVMSDCHPLKLVRYMGVARSENWEPTEITYCGTFKPSEQCHGVRFDTINVENLTTSFTVTGDVVNQGLIGIKGLGESAASVWTGQRKFTSIDALVDELGKDKTVFERFIKLGSFRQFDGYENARATWEYYRYKYCSGKDITKLRKEVRAKLLLADGWTEEKIQEERDRQISEYFKVYPNRRKVPAKMENWMPKPDDTPEKVMALFEEDFGLEEVLEFEKAYLGYYLHSPLDLYRVTGDCSIEEAKVAFAKDGEARLEGVITDYQVAQSKNNTPYGRVILSDGVQNTLVLIFGRQFENQNKSVLKPGTGVQMYVEYDKMRNTFSLMRGETIIKLLPRDMKKGNKSAASEVEDK
jgi:DNA polymerase III alpha subunit